MIRKILSCLVAIGIIGTMAPSSADGNMSYSPWVHKIIQKGEGFEVTVSIFDKTTATNADGEPLPGLGTAYTLTRWGWSETGSVDVFKDRIFDPAQASEVTDFTCHNWYGDIMDEDCPDGGVCEDCDSDSVSECYGFCGIAYRYKVMDECLPHEQQFYYSMYTSPPYDLYAPGEGLGMTTPPGHDENAECGGSDFGCSVGTMGYSAGREGPRRSLMTLALSLITADWQ